MKLNEMVLVTENWKGTEINSLMKLEDFLVLADVENMETRNDVAQVMTELGRTLGDKEAWAEVYLAMNKSIFARYCADEKQLAKFLEGFYNSTDQEWRFDETTCSPECIQKLKEIGMNTKGWITGEGMHYTKLDETFTQGQIFHNFNGHDYRVIERLSDKNLLVMDVDSGSFTVALGINMYARHPKNAAPTESNSMIAAEWDHGRYLGQTPSAIDFRRIRQEYGTPKQVEDIYDYHTKLKSQFQFFMKLSTDELATDLIKEAAVQSMYKEFGTGKEDTFYDNLEDGKYDCRYTGQITERNTGKQR